MKVYTQSDLSDAKCCGNHAEACSRGRLYLHSACHPSEPTWGIYHAGVLTIICAECRREVAKFLIAEKP